MSYRTPSTFAELQPGDHFAFKAGSFKCRRGMLDDDYFGLPFGQSQRCADAATPVFDVFTHEEQHHQEDMRKRLSETEGARARAAFQDRMRHVAKAINFKLEAQRDMTDVRAFASEARLTRDGQELLIRLGGYRNEGRLTIYALVPDPDTGRMSTPGGIMIHCNANKSPAAIALGITKRVLSGYAKKLAAANEQRAKVTEYQATIARNRAMIAEAAQVLESPEFKANNPHRVYLQGINQEAAIYSDAVTLALRLTPEQAARVVRFLLTKEAKA